MCPSKERVTVRSTTRTLLTPSTVEKASAATGSAKAISTVRSALDRRSVTDSTSTSSPPRMMPTRWAARWTSDRVWLDRKTVRPAAATSRIIAWNSCWTRGSRPVLGSSMMMTSGVFMKAWMRPIFCRFPVEWSPTFLVRSASSRSASSLTTDQSTPPRRFAK